MVDCRGAVVLGESDAKLADTQVALAAAKAQLAAHDKHLASQDAAIKSLVRKQASTLAVMAMQKIWHSVMSFSSWRCRASMRVLERLS